MPMTYADYCSGLDQIVDELDAGRITLAEQDARLEAHKARARAAGVTHPGRPLRAAAVARPRAKAPAAPAVTLTREQFRRLLAPPAAPAPPRPAADPVAEKHAATIAAVVTALAAPERLTTDELGGLLAEAGSVGHGGPFYAQEAAPPLPPLPPATLASARELAGLPLGDFCAVAAGQIAAEQESGAHRAPFWRAGAR